MMKYTLTLKLKVMLLSKKLQLTRLINVIQYRLSVD